MQKAFVVPLTRTRRPALVAVLLLLVAALAGGGNAVTAADTTPPPFTPLSLALANFSTVGVDPSLGVAAGKLLRQGLAGSPLLDLKESQRVQDLLATNGPKLLTNRPGAASALADQLKCRVFVYSTLWTGPDGSKFLQMVGIDSRPRVARLYATPALPWPEDATQQQSRLLAALQAVLPPVGRVLAVLEAQGQTQLQVFPFAGNPLRGDTAYACFHAGSAEQATARPDFLPPLWTGAYSGPLTTASKSLDDVINATPGDGASVEIGDLVCLSLTKEVVALPVAGRLVLSDPPYAQVVKDEQVLGLTPVLVPADALPAETVLKLVNFEDKPAQLAAVDTLQADQITLKELPLVGGLEIATDPAGATVSVDGKELGQSPVALRNAGAGDHTITAKLAGYVTLEKKVTVQRAQSAQVSLALERQMRAVRLISQPEGALISWDGEDVGKSPAALPKVAVGTHTVTLRLAGYDDLTQDLDVPFGDKPAEFTLPLVKLVGTLKITSLPAGAQITVAGKARGAAPVELADLAPGDYEVTATLDGYRPAKRILTVKARESATVAMDLARQVGVINIKTVPAGAKITLDGQPRGVSPARLEDIPAGEHTVRLEVANLRPWEGKVAVTDGAVSQVQVGLLPLQMEMSTGGAKPPVQPIAPTPVTPAPLLGGIGAPTDGRDFEGAEEVPVTFAAIDLTDGQQHSWSFPLLKPGETETSASEQIKLDFLPHADGGVTVSLSTRAPLPTGFTVESAAGTLVTSVPGVRALHNPAGVRINDPGLKGVKLTNSGPEGNLQVTLALASGAQITTTNPTAAQPQLTLKISRPLLMGGSKRVALTFDDTPFIGYTERLMKLLREYRVVATFFVVGRKAADSPELIRRLHEDGHAIENHSQTHPHLTALSPTEMRSELDKCSEVIAQILGDRPKYYRPPGGNGNAQVDGIARGLGLAYAGWDVNVHDYNTPQAQLIADRVVSGTRNGDIILLHDGVDATLQALPDIITRLRREGVTFVTLDALLAPKK
ncbi:MAG TPA: PEGA domain-containing protein [Armatimonadota bacterium]|jgi:peptidoglycan/xylan/chitin deacetylase (PgdA/CDA1 family)